MTTDTLAPTKEWMRHHEHQKAHTDQKTQATAYRGIAPAEICHRKGDLSDEQFAASKRFYRAYACSVLGADVREDDELPGAPADPDYPTREAMASDLSYARRMMSNRVNQVMELFLVAEMDLKDIGRMYMQTRTDAIARAIGLTYVREGLDICAWAWGISQTRP